jgi:hypothetical protein
MATKQTTSETYDDERSSSDVPFLVSKMEPQRTPNFVRGEEMAMALAKIGVMVRHQDFGSGTIELLIYDQPTAQLILDIWSMNERMRAIIEEQSTHPDVDNIQVHLHLYDANSEMFEDPQIFEEMKGTTPPHTQWRIVTHLEYTPSLHAALLFEVEKYLVLKDYEDERKILDGRDYF